MRDFCLLVLALGGVSTVALAQPQPALPDFPVEARPGECWARRPVGASATASPAAQSVWTLERGAGPGAVWNYSQAPSARSYAHSPVLNWARVDCRSGAPMHHEHAAPPAFAEPAPPLDAERPVHGPHAAPEFRPPHNPYAASAPVFAPHAAPQLPPPHRAYAQAHPYPHGPDPDPRGGLLAGPYPHAPATFGHGPLLHPQHPPQRLLPAPQFGARFLHWPGKTLR